LRRGPEDYKTRPIAPLLDVETSAYMIRSNNFIRAPIRNRASKSYYLLLSNNLSTHQNLQLRACFAPASSPTPPKAPIFKISSRALLVARHFSSTPSFNKHDSPHSYTNMSTGYKVRKIGAPNTLEHRIFIEDAAGQIVSPFHDIPLYANDAQTILNMVVEIPRWTNGKLEISKEQTMNPIASHHVSPLSRDQLTDC
jgi:hypothetical protein